MGCCHVELETLLSSSLMWLLVGDPSSLPYGLLYILPECPHHTAAGFPSRECLEREKARVMSEMEVVAFT